MCYTDESEEALLHYLGKGWKTKYYMKLPWKKGCNDNPCVFVTHHRTLHGCWDPDLRPYTRGRWGIPGCPNKWRTSKWNRGLRDVGNFHATFLVITVHWAVMIFLSLFCQGNEQWPRGIIQEFWGHVDFSVSKYRTQRRNKTTAMTSQGV